ncbi:hypothetical protein VM98_23225 [Streptomyces rubellomurinus subsp. indigoferus]|nr:hypothetical protein VM98_23225 [Streptomyces rubellomurinus subsp. indigoferus]
MEQQIEIVAHWLGFSQISPIRCVCQTSALAFSLFMWACAVARYFGDQPISMRIDTQLISLECRYL